MPEKYTIVIHKTSGKAHYILKGVGDLVIPEGAGTLCGLVSHHNASKVLSTTSTRTKGEICERCVQAFKRLKETKLTKEKLKEVKMLETSDGKTFPLKAREAALKHENGIVTAKERKEFIDSVKDTLFTVTTAEEDYLDEELVEQFEQDLSEILKATFEDLDDAGYEATLKEFLSFFHAMLNKHGRTIRSMLILYQKIHGSLVPCRNTMEKMKDAGIYL